MRNIPCRSGHSVCNYCHFDGFGQCHPERGQHYTCYLVGSLQGCLHICRLLRPCPAHHTRDTICHRLRQRVTSICFRYNHLDICGWLRQSILGAFVLSSVSYKITCHSDGCEGGASNSRLSSSHLALSAFSIVCLSCVSSNKRWADS